MSLTTLSLTCETRPDMAGSPISKLRASILQNIIVQRQLLAGERAGTPVAMTKTVRNKDGTESIKNLRPRRWFFMAPDGGLRLQVLHGHKPIPLNAEGATTIVAGDLDGVEAALTVVAEAVNRGDLDSALEAARAARPKASKPKASK